MRGHNLCFNGPLSEIILEISSNNPLLEPLDVLFTFIEHLYTHEELHVHDHLINDCSIEVIEILMMGLPMNYERLTKLTEI